MERAGTAAPLKRIDYLDVLRFALAFLTMAWHYYYFGPRVGQIDSPAADFFALRYFSFSVEVFFIISGFVVIASAINRRPVDFLIGRLVRLGPCLLVCATLSMAAGLAFGHWPTAKSYVASLLIIPLAWSNGADWSYWSLRLELMFYGLIFLSAWFINIERNLFRIAVLLAACDAAGIVAMQVFGVDLFGSANVQYPVDRYMSFFSIGMLLYALLAQKRRGIGIALALMLAFATGAWHCFEDANRIAELTRDTAVHALSGACVMAAGIAAFIAFARSTSSPRAAAFFAALGKTSYPLYLLHQNMGYLLIRYADAHLHLGFAARPLVMAGMVVASAGIALFIEPVLAVYYKRYLRAAAAMFSGAWTRLIGFIGYRPSR